MAVSRAQNLSFEAVARAPEPPRRAAFWRQVLPQGDADAHRVAISLAVALGDVVAVLASAAGFGTLYHAFAYPGDASSGGPALGYVVAAFLVGALVLKGEYQAERALRPEPGARLRLLALWTGAFVCALAVAFVTKTTAQYSRGAALLFFTGGFAVLLGMRALIVLAAARSAAARVLTRRVMLVGHAGAIAEFRARTPRENPALRIVLDAELRPAPDDPCRQAQQLAEDLALAAHTARFIAPDDIVILAPWSRHDLIERCVDAFLNLPASIHLGPERILDRFADEVAISRLGAFASINLVRRPLSTVEVAAKRVVDVVLAALALATLSPLLLLVALLIRLDSPGPVLFRQTRYGFNQQPFRIFKFRSMTVQEDGAVVRQAVRDDPRITPLGRVLRRTNIDELPQLLNVLRGDMSLVGPRPHAMAHDQAHERQFARYARRHSVKPGITGWAQVNGLRGEIQNEAAMRARVEHDLYYIDHWSLWLDLKILLLTGVSRKAYRNAR